jgi:tripartite-type tricarboxylate transporter receptor subunit TctC
MRESNNRRFLCPDATRRQALGAMAAFGGSSLLGSALIAPSVAHAQAAVPGRTVRIVVPFAPGGSGDISARMFGEFLSKKTGQNVVVENKPGANGIVGVEAAKRMPNDGSTLLLSTTSTHLANPSLFKSLPYDPLRDFTLVGHFGGGSLLVLVRPQSPYRSITDIVNAAKAQPDKLNYGHFNASSHIPGAMLGHVAGVRMTPVPYKAIGNAMTDLMAGQIDIIFVDSIAGDGPAQSGKLRAIAAYGNKRLPKYPDVALITEAYPSYRLSSGMLGISVPAGASQAVLQGLNDLCNEAISNEPMKSALINFGFDPVPMSLAELSAYVPREQAIWREQVGIAKIEPQ